jgi:hypothetical protein
MTYDISDIKDSDKLKDEEGELNIITQAMINVLPLIGLNVVTQTNTGEIFLRIALMERIIGPLLKRNNEPVYFTLDTVKQHIGLKVTNSNLMSTMDYWRRYLHEIDQVPTTH